MAEKTFRPKKYSKAGTLHSKRRLGRPRTTTQTVRRARIKVRFIREYGITLFHAMDYLGYATMVRNPKARRTAEIPAVNPLNNKPIKDLTCRKIKSDIGTQFRDLINAITGGKDVPGFTVLPAATAATDPTGDVILIDDFSPDKGFHPNHRLRGQALVLLKPAFIPDEFRPQHASLKEFVEAAKKEGVDAE